jgi:hypothetical protein
VAGSPRVPAIAQSIEIESWLRSMLMRRSTLPGLVLSIFFQRSFDEGIAASGIKG